MYRSGIRTFLEVGPDRKLTGLVGAILGGREHAALAVDASRGQRGNLADLARHWRSSPRWGTRSACRSGMREPIATPLPTPRRPASRA